MESNHFSKSKDLDVLDLVFIFESIINLYLLLMYILKKSHKIYYYKYLQMYICVYNIHTSITRKR